MYGEGRPSLLIDTSTDLRFQALRANITRIDSVLYTHAHADHIFGLEDLKGYNFAQNCPIPLYGSALMLGELRAAFPYIFSENSEYEGGFKPKFTLHEFNAGQNFEISGTRITPFLLYHGSKPVSGFRIGDMAYATDCNRIPEESMRILSGVKLLFIDGLRYEAHRTHFTIPQAIEVAQTLKAERTFILHTTHTVDYDEVMAKLPAGIELAYDGLTVEFDERYALQEST